MATHSRLLPGEFHGLYSLWGLKDLDTTEWLSLSFSEEEEKKKGYEKIFEESIGENFPSMEKEIVNQDKKAQSPIQDKPKEKHAKAHTNQTNKE